MGSDHTDVEQLTQKYLHAEMEGAATFVRVAATAYGYGDRVKGDANIAKAEQACTDVERCLDDAQSRGWDMRAARRQLTALRDAIARLMRRVNEAEWPREAA